MRFIKENLERDGVDRRGFLRCMAWAGTGALCVLRGGVLRSESLSDPSLAAPAGELSFVQISDSHIGFNKAANPDVAGTLKTAIARINALPKPPAFILHTGDLTQLSKPAEFDNVAEILKSARAGQVFYVPGEHDVLDGSGRAYRERFAPQSRGAGWYSFDHQGVHFAGLVNVVDLKAGGLGQLGTDQLEWLEKDLAPLSASTPIVVFAHIPLWTVYEQWGWGTTDAQRALSYLRRFGSVTVLNGHIHQTMQKVEGNITFHTARSTAFPQPAPGTAPGPGPMTVPAGELTRVLGVTEVQYRRGSRSLGIVDESLASGPPARRQGVSEIAIQDFAFVPPTLNVTAGAEVDWVNHDDEPHKIASSDHAFSASPVLDTGDHYTLRLARAGTFPYFCTIHPEMVGRIVVR